MKKPIRVVNCIHCGKEKKTSRPLVLYCGSACKMAHWRENKGNKGFETVTETATKPKETVTPTPQVPQPGIYERVITLSGTMGTLRGWHSRGVGSNCCWCDHCRDYYLQTGIRRIRWKTIHSTPIDEYCRNPQTIAENGGVDLNESADKWNRVERPKIRVVRLNNPDQAPD